MNEHKLREPCKFCKSETGLIETKGGQDCVRCINCNRHLYNAPKTETGRKARTLSTTHEGIKPKQRAAILFRAGGRCELCGKRPASEEGMHVGHILSVKDGHTLDLTDREINSDENLMALCAECNLGIGEQTLPLWLAEGIVKARCSAEEKV